MLPTIQKQVYLLNLKFTFLILTDFFVASNENKKEVDAFMEIFAPSPSPSMTTRVVAPPPGFEHVIPQNKENLPSIHASNESLIDFGDDGEKPGPKSQGFGMGKREAAVAFPKSNKEETSEKSPSWAEFLPTTPSEFSSTMTDPAPFDAAQSRHQELLSDDTSESWVSALSQTAAGPFQLVDAVDETLTAVGSFAKELLIPSSSSANARRPSFSFDAAQQFFDTYEETVEARGAANNNEMDDGDVFFVRSRSPSPKPASPRVDSDEYESVDEELPRERGPSRQTAQNAAPPLASFQFRPPAAAAQNRRFPPPKYGGGQQRSPQTPSTDNRPKRGGRTNTNQRGGGRGNWSGNTAPSPVQNVSQDKGCLPSFLFVRWFKI
jgi:hypothetical protein